MTGGAEWHFSVATVAGARCAEQKTVIIDATYFKAHRAASSLRVERDLGSLICRTIAA
jgi:hypothetical protein